MKILRFLRIVIAMALFVSFINLVNAQEVITVTPRSICPVTKMSERCLECHRVVLRDGKPAWGLREIRPYSHMDPPARVRILDGKGYYLIGGEISTAESNSVRDYLEYLTLHKIKHAILDIHSAGGPLFASWRVKGLMDEFIAQGGIVETIVRGFAASGASIIFVAGSKGYRKINPQAGLMFHELSSFKFLDISTPSDKEDEARVLRHLQDTITSWLATRGTLTKAELDEKMRKKEFWLNGEEAVKFGFADRLLGR